MLCLNDSWASRVTETQCKQTCSCNTFQSRGRKAGRQTDSCTVGNGIEKQPHNLASEVEHETRPVLTFIGAWSSCSNDHSWLRPQLSQDDLIASAAVSLAAWRVHSHSPQRLSIWSFKTPVHSCGRFSFDRSFPTPDVYVSGDYLPNHYCSQWARVSVSHCCPEIRLCVDRRGSDNAVLAETLNEDTLTLESFLLLSLTQSPWNVWCQCCL